MKILAADTSTHAGSVALLEGERVMAEWTLYSAETHNRLLLKTIDFLLRQIGWELEDVDGFAVSKGPGSFTGTRIGLSSMKTLAWALGKPYGAVASLDVLAAPLAFASLPVCPLLDARKKEVYCALYEPDGRGSLMQRMPYRVMSPERLAGEIQGPTLFCGDGWLLYRETLEKELGDWTIGAPSPYHVIRASFIGEWARRRFLAGQTDDPMTSTPLYVRPSEAELKSPQTPALSG